jgi:hypothetical protein
VCRCRSPWLSDRVFGRHRTGSGNRGSLDDAAELAVVRLGLLGTVALAGGSGRQTGRVTSSGRSSVFAGYRFPREVIAVAVRWYLRYGLSYRDVEELERSRFFRHRIRLPIG